MVVWAGTLNPYGRVHVEHAETHMPLRFPGHWHDAETGLHFNLQPGAGRYIGPDPWGIAGGVNLYAYVGEDNPLRAVDVDGLMMSAGRRTGSFVVRAASSGRLVPSSAGHAAPPPPRPPLEKPSSVAPAERQLCLPLDEPYKEFFHGTSKEAARSMLNDGLKEGTGQTGRGFYVSSSRRVAQEYMADGKDGKTVTVRVKTSDLEKMKPYDDGDEHDNERTMWIGNDPLPEEWGNPDVVHSEQSQIGGPQTMFRASTFSKLQVRPGMTRDAEGQSSWVHPDNRVEKKG